MKIEFSGAAQEVTGSKHLIHVNGKKILLDCGMYHGKRKETEEKNKHFSFDPKEISAVILSHAHIDHSGLIPLLVKQGFTGPIYCTHATRDLCQHMLADSAYIQEREAEYLNQKKAKKGEELNPLSPMRLFYLGDTLKHMRRYGEAVEVLNKGIEMDPNNDNPHWSLWLIYVDRGMYKDALREMEKLIEIGGIPGWNASPEEMEEFEIVSKERGWKGGLEWNLDRMIEKAKKEHVSPFLVAQCHVILGHKAEAIRWLERAYSERDMLMPYLNTEAAFDPIRNDPRFAEILKRMGFPK